MAQVSSTHTVHYSPLSMDQEWRTGYLKFTAAIAANPAMPYKTVDQHHLESIRLILTARGLISNTPDGLVSDGSLWNEAQVQELNLVWHQLNPWPDTCQGLAELNKKFHTCTLSNGNLSLLHDMVEHAKMPFTHVYSAEMFNSYKPNPKVYLGGAEKIGLKPEECAMVAAHLDDLNFAKSCGLKTVYVERAREEAHPGLSDEGIPDVWVGEGQGGFVTAAERLGVDVGR